MGVKMKVVKEKKYIVLGIFLYIILNISIHVDFLKQFDFLSYTNSLLSLVLITNITYIKIKLIKTKKNKMLFNYLTIVTVLHFIYLICIYNCIDAFI